MLETEVKIIEKTEIFNKNRDAKTRYIFNPGGTRSSKTHSLLQLFYAKASNDPKFNIYSIVSETMPHLRKGAMRDFFMFLSENDLYDERNHNKSDNIYKIGNSIIEFFSVDTASKIHGPERDYLLVNELNNIDYDTFFHLAQRTRKQIYADWNPTSEFFVYPEFIFNSQYKDDITVIHSTIKDNPFVSEAIKKDVYRRAERDENYKRVYLLGEIGQPEGLIYPNWKYGEFNDALPHQFGLDFGFNPDPDAMVKVAIDEKRKLIYLHECFYERDQLLQDLKNNISKHANINDLIIADSASPRLIAELKIKHNIKGVIKKAGSVNEGIRLMQDYDLIITKESINLVKELRNYVWSDKKAGIPIDDWNHLLDPARYVIQSQRKSAGRQIWRTSNV